MCEFLINNEKCRKKSCYGNFCKKHRREYLIKDDKIIFERFTNNITDYFKDDFIKSLKNVKKLEKKNYYFNEYLKFYNTLKNYLNDTDKIIKIQSLQRKNYIKKNIFLRGVGFLNRQKCSNNEDFFTYEDKNEIPEIYFISYKDSKDFIWCFDIRSFIKLLEHGPINPYTRVEFPSEILVRCESIKQLLKRKNIVLDYNSEIIKERKNNIKQITVDLFSEIEISGYDCDIKWFLGLNIIQLKKLYKILEDIWNYRAMLSQEAKNNIVPPNGRVFTTRVQDVMRITNKRELQQLIINEVCKFKTAVTSSDRNIGFMYFLMGLCFVCQGCNSQYGWMIIQ